MAVCLNFEAAEFFVVFYISTHSISIFEPLYPKEMP
jgi:hypothetical protein